MLSCNYCNRDFGTERALEQHKEATNHWACTECDKVYHSSQALTGHYVQSARHHYCQYCDEHFSDEEDWLDHGEEDHFACTSCSLVYPTQPKYRAHMRKDHNYYCAPCDRDLLTQSNLESHENSSTHKPKNIPCPSDNCGKSFVSHSALILHLETDTCPSGVTKRQLNDTIFALDHRREFTKQPLTLEINFARIGSELQCCLCHHKPFSAPTSLQAHLRSPRHALSCMFFCPGCGAEFAYLSALCQHVERGRCDVSEVSLYKNGVDDFSEKVCLLISDALFSF